MFLTAKVHASMKNKKYKIQLWLSKTKMVKSFCECTIGNIICSHAIAVLIQMEYVSLLLSGLAEAIVLTLCSETDVNNLPDLKVSCITVLECLRKEADFTEVFLTCTQQQAFWRKPGK